MPSRTRSSPQARRGLRVAGLKAGLTSHAKMKQMGVTTPVFGFMTDDYALPDGAECKVSELIHPKVEPEIAFVTKRPLKGPGCHIGAVLAATDFVLPGIEVIDSRYRDFKFDLKSVVADNTSAARFVVGGRALPADELDLRTLGIVLEKNGEPVAFGAGAAVLGHPAAAIAMLANHLGRARPGDPGRYPDSVRRHHGSRGRAGRRCGHAARARPGQRGPAFRLRRSPCRLPRST
jgi:2-oxo-3-hexenedioate decarboxylase